MNQNPVIEMIPESPGEDRVFNILAEADHIFDGIVVFDANDVLLNDRADVEVTGYVESVPEMANFEIVSFGEQLICDIAGLPQRFSGFLDSSF